MVCLQTGRTRSRRPNIRTMSRAHTAVQCTERSVLRGECASATLRAAQSRQGVLHLAHAARAYRFAASLASLHSHIRAIPRICDLRRSPNFPLPNTATRVAIASPRRGHLTLSPPSPLTLSARPHRSAVNVVSGSRLIRPDAHYTTLPN